MKKKKKKAKQAKLKTIQDGVDEINYLIIKENKGGGGKVMKNINQNFLFNFIFLFNY